jgi:hypothetical protein
VPTTHATITRRRERRFLALVAAGATISEAGRAVSVSRSTIYTHARASPAFRDRLIVARAGQSAVALDEPDDWRAVARRLEQSAPERWSRPDPIDSFREFDPTA